MRIQMIEALHYSNTLLWFLWQFFLVDNIFHAIYCY